ncbi:MAG: hypothetical protein H8Z69_01645 [Nanohaloarchaea archaeon]|nr:hypothetical protein [Candidatus Nanohaloarchaea archaeon]
MTADDYFDEEESGDELNDLYDMATDEEGVAHYHGDLEADPSRWDEIVESARFSDSLRQLDELMADYDHELELHVGEESFTEREDLDEQPFILDLYIVEDHEEFTEEVNHPFFQRMDPERFNRPDGLSISIGFGQYEDTLDVPEDYQHLDIKVPTRQAVMSKRISSFSDEISDSFEYDSLPEDPDNTY